MTNGKKTRNRPLRVYGGNHNGTYRMIMACHSMKEFMAATGISRDYFCETGNKEEIAIAMDQPGTIFKKLYSYRDGFPESHMYWHKHKSRLAKQENESDDLTPGL